MNEKQQELYKKITALVFLVMKEEKLTTLEYEQVFLAMIRKMEGVEYITNMKKQYGESWKEILDVDITMINNCFG